MTAVNEDTPAPSGRLRFRAGRYRGLIVAAVVLIALLVFNDVMSAGPMSYFEVSFISSGGATLAFAAAGQTLVILTGGFDLSAGAVVSLVNVVLATQLGDPSGGLVTGTLIGIGIGCLAGAFNGFFVAVMRLQPIVVTLSTMFIVQGITLFVMDKPGGMVPFGLSAALTQDAIPGLLPMPLVLIGVLILAWLWLKKTRFGTAIYAIGSDMDAARAQGVRVVWVRFWVYVLAGGCYGFAGVYISAQTGAGDPLVGNPMLLQIFAAVVVGGTVLGGGRGGVVGSIIGAYVLMIVVNILLVLNVSAYYSTVAEGLILILAVLAGALGRNARLATWLRQWARRLAARRHGHLPRQGARQAEFLRLPEREAAVVAATLPPFRVRHAEAIRYALPAYLCFVGVVLATQFVIGHALFSWTYYNSLLVLSSFLLILALGQGTVILTGGLDLSVPWIIGLCGILLTGLVNGQDGPLIYALPLVLGVGALIGALNGIGVAVLGLSPIVMTLAMNGILQGAALLYSQGTPAGYSAPLMRWFMTARPFGVTPVVWLVIGFVILSVVLLTRTPFGRRVYGIGNGQRVAALSGINVDRTLIAVYMLSGFCAALVGCLLTGFSGQASLGMGDEYLLPSIAVVVVGGTLITGGRGTYLGMVGGVLLLTALQTLLAGTTLPYATRAILFGLVVLGAVIALRERNT
ncbi:ABC transporter permease [Ostreiculturibacter nitratireducens]|uniref:ABC transporter permease n=1 Tax=Ostreiculturibacter nitratireducens TaxID=3075226 RepID=UPI0031B62585